MAGEILYIHPSKIAVATKDYSQIGVASPYALMPVGVIGLVNLLRGAGFDVQGLNYPIEVIIDRSFDLKNWLRARSDARLILIDLHWYEHTFGAFDVASLCKATLPQAYIAMGGLTASIYAKELLRHFREVDYVIQGDAEEPLLALARLVCRGEGDLANIPNLGYRDHRAVRLNKRTYCATADDLDRLDFVDLSFLSHERDYAEMQYASSEWESSDRRGHWLCNGRGCFYNCAFCGGGANVHRSIAGRQGIIARSPEVVVHDMERLAERGVQQISPTLDPAIMGEAYWRALFSRMREHRVRMGLNIEHFQLPSMEFFTAFLESADLDHSELVFSPLSGSERVRALNGKTYSNQALLEALSFLAAHEVPVYIYFSLNLPGETMRTLDETLTLARRICDLYPPRKLRMANMCHTVDPASPLAQRPREYQVRVQFDSLLDYYEYCRQTPTIQQGVRLEAWRGFRALDYQAQPLDLMAQRWDQFCKGQAATCNPVLRAW